MEIGVVLGLRHNNQVAQVPKLPNGELLHPFFRVLASVLRSQPQCQCQVLNGGGSSLGPGACNVQTPPIT
ncbi:hypothetical protein GYH30_029027 [Glycine max]|uniref:Uncharacterized protein n=1 Tax=Glycine max TaxID=3847 RepID=K7LL89_SOYBN|nr:hypothetical protein GYH30_029027 [Glycine max]